MATLVRIKKEIQFNGDLSALLGTLRSIAASQFHGLERRLQPFDALTEAVRDCLSFLDLEHTMHPFVMPSQAPPAVVAVTSDSGLLGGLNVQVMNAAIGLLQQGGSGSLIIVGERGCRYARERGYRPIAFPGIGDETRYVRAVELREYCVEQVLKGHLGALSVVYPRALSFTHQEVTTLPMIPCRAWAPRRAQPPVNALLESSSEDLVEYLVACWMEQQFCEIFGTSRLAELAARAVHLEGSSQELQRRGGRLRLEYFRSRREMIDRTMRELATARISHGNRNC